MSRGPKRWAASPAVPWVLVIAVLIAALAIASTPPQDIAVYLAYWTLGIVVPGTLVHRVLRGSRGNLVEDASWGAATGLVLEMVAWFVTTLAHVHAALALWPLLVYAVVLGVPSLRRRLRTSVHTEVPLAWSWAVAGSAILAIAWVTRWWLRNPIPPAQAAYYQDLWYHYSLVHELMRYLPFRAPQAADEPLKYHFLADAHIATASMITRVPARIVFFRLWIGPVLIATCTCAATLAREVTGRWWIGAVTAYSGVMGAGLTLGIASAQNQPVSFLSPSASYVMPLFLLAVSIVVGILRAPALRPALVVFLLVVGVVCAGAKMSSPPLLLGGMAIAAVARLIATRRLDRVTAGALVTVAMALGCGYLLFAGAGSGTLELQPLSQLSWWPPYQAVTGVTLPVAGHLPTGLSGGAAWAIAALGVVWWLVSQAPRLIGVFAARERAADGGFWFVAGAVVTGSAAMWGFFHPGDSQAYFFLPVIPLGVILTAWAADRLPRRWLVAAAVVGAVLAWALAWITIPVGTHPLTGWTIRLAVPVVALVVVVAIAVVVVARGRLRGRAAAYPLVAAIALGATTYAGFDSVNADVIHAAAHGQSLSSVVAPSQAPTSLITRDEMEGALWLETHSGLDDVVATNVHCQPIRTVRGCVHYAFWVSGLSGRRILVEGWGYTDGAFAEAARTGRNFRTVGFDRPALLAANDAAFAHPTRSDLAVLRAHHVRWLFADSRAGHVDRNALGRFARVRFRAGPVAVYELTR